MKLSFIYAFILAIFLICEISFASDEAVMRYRVESKGGKTVACQTFSTARYVFKKGDMLEYDVYLKSNRNGIGGIDIITNHAMRLSDLNVKDSKNIAINPSADLSVPAFGKWYKRQIIIPRDMIGEESSEWIVMASGIFETGEKAEADFRNIRIVNGSKTAFTVYTTGFLPMNRINMANEATVSEITLVSAPLNDKIRTTLDWFHSMLPDKKYIAIHAESYDAEKGKWISGCPTYQPFKSMVFKPWNIAFWRKDDIINDFYGELFTYDLTTLRLHTESMPPRAAFEPETQPAWDARPDRSRVFVQTSNGYDNWFTDNTIVYDWEPNCLVRFTTGNSTWKFNVERDASENWAVGRAIAPVSGDTSWSFRGTLNTYLANSYDQLNNGNAPLIQLSINDYVTVTKIKNFNSVYDGVCEGWEPDPEFVQFDEAFAVNQHMNNNGGRERFIFARKGNFHYGLVRWDNSKMVNGKWIVTDRAAALRLADDDKGSFFKGMYGRVMNDKWIQPKELGVRVDSYMPANISGAFNISIQNIGMRAWQSGKFFLHGRLMDESWKPIDGSDSMLFAIDKDISPLDSYKTRISIPDKWHKGTYYLVLEMREGDKKFSSAGDIPFVKKIKIK